MLRLHKIITFAYVAEHCASFQTKSSIWPILREDRQLLLLKMHMESSIPQRIGNYFFEKCTWKPVYHRGWATTPLKNEVVYESYLQQPKFQDILEGIRMWVRTSWKTAVQA